MTIVKVKLAPGQDWRPVCVACEKRIHPPDAIYADIDGRTFIDYYHASCIPTDEKVPS
jgi:hypothetical protein